jgi:hypothetical protein
VTWQAHVDDKTSSKEAAYAMIMGMDLMKSIGNTADCAQRCKRWGGMLIPQVRPAHKYLISPWEMIHLPVGDNALCIQPYTVYTAVCYNSLTATYQ